MGKTGPGRGRVDPLFVSEISSWLNKKTALVFFSAYSAADAANEDLSEENLDTANEFAVLGVPDVVGSMWPVSSSVATQVASTLWIFLSYFFPNGGILEEDLVAPALYFAVLTAAGAPLDDPLAWAGFIRVGGMGSRSLGDVRGSADDDENWVTTDDESAASEEGSLEEGITSD